MYPDGQQSGLKLLPGCNKDIRMKHAFSLEVFVVAAALLVSGCATHPAPDFGGRWRPVNRFASAPAEIPLYSSYVYQASPMDGTLKTMLERWSRDSGRALDYRLASDFTLYGAVARIDTTNAQQAVIELTAAYAPQGISVSIDGNTIIVQNAISEAAPDASVPQAGG